MLCYERGTPELQVMARMLATKKRFLETNRRAVSKRIRCSNVTAFESVDCLRANKRTQLTASRSRALALKQSHGCIRAIRAAGGQRLQDYNSKKREWGGSRSTGGRKGDSNGGGNGGYTSNGDSNGGGPRTLQQDPVLGPYSRTTPRALRWS